jgi:hypothetical protein
VLRPPGDPVERQQRVPVAGEHVDRARQRPARGRRPVALAHPQVVPEQRQCRPHPVRVAQHQLGHAAGVDHPAGELFVGEVERVGDRREQVRRGVRADHEPHRRHAAAGGPQQRQVVRHDRAHAVPVERVRFAQHRVQVPVEVGHQCVDAGEPRLGGPPLAARQLDRQHGDPRAEPFLPPLVRRRGAPGVVEAEQPDVGGRGVRAGHRRKVGRRGVHRWLRHRWSAG